jgi:hypothetical protein
MGLEPKGTSESASVRRASRADYTAAFLEPQDEPAKAALTALYTERVIAAADKRYN